MPKWYEREQPLARCPLPECRRSQGCRHATETDPCRRLWMGQEEAYASWADTIDRLRDEMIASRPPGREVKPAKPGTALFEQRLSQLYRLLRARDEENSASEMAELARRRAQREKPPGTPGEA